MEELGRKMKRVMITGASGFLGHAISSYASRNPDWEIYGVISGRRKVNLPKGVQEVKTNIYDPLAVKEMMNHIRPEIMVHLAWALEGRDFLGSSLNIQCLEASLNILRFFADNGGERLVFSGSSAEYGYEQSVCNESDICRPSDLYGRCKLSFTETARFFCEKNRISYVTARYFSVYGAGEKHLIHAVPLSINTMMKGKRFICKAPQNAWDYVYIDDVGEATVRIMDSQFTGIVNVGTGIASTMREVFQTVADNLGTDRLLEFSDQTDGGKKSIANTDILNKKIGYICKTGLADGIKKTIKWMKQEGAQ